jgi:four helix bundle protein
MIKPKIMSEFHLSKFELNKVARDFSRLAWQLFDTLPKEIRWKTGWQFLEAADSVQANIVEAYGRFHYKDKRNFEYHARGSLLESMNWAEILHERGFISHQELADFLGLGNRLSVKLNNHINYLNTQINPNDL